MRRRMCGLILMVMFSQAVIKPSELDGFRARLKQSNAYITANGDYVNIMMPLSQLYQGKTLYFTKQATEVAAVLGEIISTSDGKVHLQGLLNQNIENLSFQTSSVYAQVSHLSEYLLSNTLDVSYAPIVVNAYEKNKNYGIWKIYPTEEVFLNIKLRVD